MENFTAPIVADVKYASFFKRSLAAFLDIILVSLVLMPIIGKIITPPEYMQQLARDYNNKIITYEEFSERAAEYMTNEGGFNIFFADFSYQWLIIAAITIVFWHYKSATPGKMLISLKIVDEKTLGKLTLKQQIVRYLGYIISGLPFFLGFFWIIFSKKKQAWHDIIAGSIVIDVKKDNV